MVNKCSRRVLVGTIVKRAFDNVDVLGARIVNVEIEELLSRVNLDLQDTKAAWSLRRKQGPFSHSWVIIN